MIRKEIVPKRTSINVAKDENQRCGSVWTPRKRTRVNNIIKWKENVVTLCSVNTLFVCVHHKTSLVTPPFNVTLAQKIDTHSRPNVFSSFKLKIYS